MRDLTKIKVQEFNRGEDLVVQINHLPQSQSFNECNVRDKTLDIYLDNPLKSTLDPVNTYCTCEILLSWQSSNSNQELQLIKTPELITAKDPNYEEKALIKINQLFNQLNEEKAQNQILQQQLEQLKSQIHQAEEENAAMKTSKFWKLRTQWFRIKKIFGFKE